VLMCAQMLFFFGVHIRLYVCIFSEELSRLAARKYARVIQKLGFPVSMRPYPESAV